MKKLLATGLLLAFVLVSCSRETPSPTSTTLLEVSPIPPTASPVPPTETSQPTITPTTGPTATSAPTGYGPDNFPPDVNPLTGLKVADVKLLERRPIGIKINIVPRETRPPWGLSFADIVYEYYHNDGYARYHALFYGQDAELAGPIRSARLPDEYIIRMYKNLFVYGGADSKIENRFYSTEFADRLIREGETIPCPPSPAVPLCRVEPEGYNYLLGGTSEISQYATSKKISNDRQNLNGMTFNTILPAGGKPASELYVRYSSDHYSQWKYDSASGKYLLFQDNVWDQGQGEQYAPLLDRVTNQQLGADNVVVVIVPHEYFTPPPAEIVNILLSGSGKAYAYRDGQVSEVTWNVPAVDSVLYLTLPDGTPYAFKPGNTWIHLVSLSTEIVPQADGSLRFNMNARLP